MPLTKIQAMKPGEPISFNFPLNWHFPRGKAKIMLKQMVSTHNFPDLLKFISQVVMISGVE